MDLSLQVAGAPQLAAKVATPSPVVRLAEALGLQQVTRAIGDAARERSPYDTGALQGAITDKVSGSSSNLFGEVTSTIFYGVYLETDDRYHYRATGRQGQQTAGWFGGAPAQAEQSGAIAKVMNDLAIEVQRVWEQP